MLDFGIFSLRIHRWYRADDDRALHDHPFWFWTIILRGGYTDISKNVYGTTYWDTLTAGSSRFRPAEFKHTVQKVLPNTWTFLITGRGGRRWGFWDNATGKRVGRDKWFVTKGHHPCDETGKPVRMKPDGSRV